MGRPLDLTVFNAESRADQVVQDNNINFMTSGQDRERMLELEAKTWDELTHSEKKEIYRITNYYNVTYNELSAGAIPDGADGIADFINGYYNFGSGPVTADTIVSDPSAITANGLEFDLLSNAASILGELLSTIITVDYTIVIEWEETKSVISGQPIIFAIGSGTGSFPEDYLILQNLGGTMPNQAYFLEDLNSGGNSRDAISDFSGDQDAVVGINRIAVGIDATDLKGAINGFGFMDVAFGGGARGPGGPPSNVAAFAGWHGQAKHNEQQRVRSITFYPTTFDETTLEGYSTVS